MIGRPIMEREVLLLATGGTIAMRGERAVPSAGPVELLAEVGLDRVRSRELLGAPGPHIGLDDALLVARTAAAEAAAGRGVVVTHGTDTLEETALLCDLMHDGEAPVVFTGAIRPASAPGADGPANLIDAVAVAGAAQAAGLGCVVVFAGEIHAARGARKVDSAGPRAPGLPRAGDRRGARRRPGAPGRAGRRGSGRDPRRRSPLPRRARAGPRRRGTDPRRPGGPPGARRDARLDLRLRRRRGRPARQRRDPGRLAVAASRADEAAGVPGLWPSG